MGIYQMREQNKKTNGENTYNTPSTLDTKLNAECACSKRAEGSRQDPERNES
jgi:hypothetical protein